MSYCSLGVNVDPSEHVQSEGRLPTPQGFKEEFRILFLNLALILAKHWNIDINNGSFDKIKLIVVTHIGWLQKQGINRPALKTFSSCLKDQ